jgi:nucleoside-diphosphate-sugar epimerase
VPPTAFVTGGSGFVGGRLIERLVAGGWTVRGLARSERSAAVVRALGAEAVRGDLSDTASLETGAAGVDACFHAAAEVSEWGPWERFQRGNVDGSRNVAEACLRAGARRLVHVGTEAALNHGQPMVRVDETALLAFGSRAHYASSKALAENAVLSVGRRGLEVVVIRPRLVWGPGDATVLPALVAAVRAGRFAWIGSARHLTSTAHVDNVVHGLLLGAERGRPGGVYFVTDGPDIEFREFVTRWLATAGVEAPDRELPPPVARALAAAGEWAWRTFPLPGAPPLTRLALWLSSVECTVDDSRARAELGYAPVITREQGLTELAGPR